MSVPARTTIAGLFVVASLLFATTSTRGASAQDTGQLKLCKVAGAGVAVGANFTFVVSVPDETVTLTVPAGPGETGGFCVLDGVYEVGTDVTIQETIPAGIVVPGIVVFGPATTKSVDLATGTIVVTIGSGTNEIRFIDESTTAVQFTRFTGMRAGRSVVLRWHTATEADLLGFQVYRSRGGSWRRITHSLIPATGSLSGASYRFVDRTAKHRVTYRYRVKAMTSDGRTSWFGPVRVT